jgi:hypothetical protein
VTNNPLVSFRNRLGLTQLEQAHQCALAVVLIQAQEKGIPHHLHPRFLSTFPDAVELIPAYHDFRTSVRRENWPRGVTVVPSNGPEFAEFLRSSGLSGAEFSEKACMPLIDINYTLHHYRIPSTLIRFFEEINGQ